MDGGLLKLPASIDDIREIENVEVEHRHHNSCKQNNKNTHANEQ